MKHFICRRVDLHKVYRLDEEKILMSNPKQDSQEQQWVPHDKWDGTNLCASNHLISNGQEESDFLYTGPRSDCWTMVSVEGAMSGTQSISPLRYSFFRGGR